MSQKLYNLVWNELSSYDLSLEKIAVRGIKSKMGRNVSDKEFLDLMSRLTNLRLKIKEDNQMKSIPLFRHLTLRESKSNSNSRDMDLEVMLKKEVVKSLKETQPFTGLDASPLVSFHRKRSE